MHDREAVLAGSVAGELWSLPDYVCHFHNPRWKSRNQHFRKHSSKPAQAKRGQRILEDLMEVPRKVSFHGPLGFVSGVSKP